MSLSLGSWPGYGPTQNRFLRVFLDALSGAGLSISTIDSVEGIADAHELDIILLHWPQRVFWEADSRTAIFAKMARLLQSIRNLPDSTKVIWVAHDLQPHDARGLQRLLWRPFMALLVRELDGFITLAPGTMTPVVEKYPGLATRPSLAAWHPLYPNESLDEDARLDARAALGYDESNRVVGYCGQLRYNKGLESLATCFRLLNGESLRLLIAGSPTGSAAELVTSLKRTADSDSRISLLAGNLAETDFRNAMAACDIFAAPFTSYLHSGSLIHALSANRPILTPRTPFSTSLQTELGKGWVTLYDGELQPSVVSDALTAPSPTGSCPLDNLTSEAVGKEIATWMAKLSH